MKGFPIFDLGICGWGLVCSDRRGGGRGLLVGSVFYSYGTRIFLNKAKHRGCDMFGLNNSGHLRG